MAPRGVHGGARVPTANLACCVGLAVDFAHGLLILGGTEPSLAAVTIPSSKASAPAPTISTACSVTSSSTTTTPAPILGQTGLAVAPDALFVPRLLTLGKDVGPTAVVTFDSSAVALVRGGRSTPLIGQGVRAVLLFCFVPDALQLLEGSTGQQGAGQKSIPAVRAKVLEHLGKLGVAALG